jgi:hypothetical protein
MVDKKGDGGLHKSDVHYRLKLSFYKTIHAGRIFFCFLAPFTKDSHKCVSLERFQKIDPELGAIDRGAEV